MLKRITIVYFSIVLLVVGISPIFLGNYSTGQQIIYAQSSLFPDEYPEGHPQLPPESSPIPPQTQLPPESSPIPPQTQLPPESSPIPPQTQLPP
jgi:hypothetical protein